MADDTNNTDAQVAAQNQTAAGATDPNAPSAATANADVGNASTTPSAPSASDANPASNIANGEGAGNGSGVGEQTTTSTPVAASGAASTLSGADSTASGSSPNLSAAASTSSGAPTLSVSATNDGVVAAKADTAFINNPASQQPSLAGTSGKQGIDTGMATDVGTPKMTPGAAANTGSNPGVDSSNVNVVVKRAPNPIVHEVQKRTKELKLIIGNQEKTPWIQRALKDLQTMEEWVVQHFEELKRKV